MRTEAWLDTLAHAAARLIDLPLRDLMAADPERAARCAVRGGGLYLNAARQRVDTAAWQQLLAIAERARVADGIRALFDGQPVNRSEQRPALHTALRGVHGDTEVARAAAAAARDAQARMDTLASQLQASGVEDVVNVGIGGSDLGPRLAVEALRDHARGDFRAHFVSNVDGHEAHAVMRMLDPRRTAVVLVSKSFGTQETLLNGELLRPWLGDDARMLAVTAKPARAQAWGIAPERVLPIWDWVGGRYSLWSAVGFVVRLVLGRAGFDALLAGAAAMDRHVLAAPPAQNLAVWHALLAIWNRNALGYDTHAVIPYDARLRLLPSYLQQLVMESLGKSVRQDGTAVAAATVPVIWGTAGTDGQHSYFQALHQGTDTVPIDFIGVVTPDHPHADSHRALLANLLAQGQALANGSVGAAPEKHYPGSRPSTTILLDRLDPVTFGALIALYEHSVYVQSLLWGINAFDQWGVELGKKIAGEVLPALSDDAIVPEDPVTAALLAEIRRAR